jgi:hypothetical protein
MDQARMSKQAIILQKTAFDSIVSSVLFYWDSTQSLSKVLLDQNPWVPEEGKRALVEWAQSNKKVLEDFKRAMDDGYGRIDSCLVGDGEKQRQERQKGRDWPERQEQQEQDEQAEHYQAEQFQAEQQDEQAEHYQAEQFQAEQYEYVGAS